MWFCFPQAIAGTTKHKSLVMVMVMAAVILLLLSTFSFKSFIGGYKVSLDSISDMNFEINPSIPDYISCVMMVMEMEMVMVVRMKVNIMTI